MGICSKKQADNFIKQAKVLVNGEPAYLGMNVNDSMQIEVDGKTVGVKPNPVFLLYNKPVGVVCTHSSEVSQSLDKVIDYPKRVFAVGRLDKNSEGLLLLTNQGDVVNRLMRAENKHQKVYHVWVDKPLTAEFLKQMRSGVEILDTVTLACKVEQLESCKFEITLIQGLNRQIRRMCKALGYSVQRLQRVKIMAFELGDMAEGELYELSQDQQQTFLQALELL